jgi:hypothetical protein
VLGEPHWKANAMRLRDEFAQYGPLDIIEDYLATTLPNAWTRRELARPQSQ